MCKRQTRGFVWVPGEEHHLSFELQALCWPSKCSAERVRSPMSVPEVSRLWSQRLVGERWEIKVNWGRATFLWSTGARCRAIWSVDSAWPGCRPYVPWGPQNPWPKQCPQRNSPGREKHNGWTCNTFVYVQSLPYLLNKTMARVSENASVSHSVCVSLQTWPLAMTSSDMRQSMASIWRASYFQEAICPWQSVTIIMHPVFCVGVVHYVTSESENPFIYINAVFHISI